MTIITPSYILSALTALLPQLVIFSASVYYFIRFKRLDSILLFLGSFFGILITVFHFVIMPFIQSENALDSMEQKIKIMNIVGPISVLGSVAFCVGFLLLIISSVKGKK